MYQRIKLFLSADLVKVPVLNGIATSIRMITSLISVKIVANLIGPSGIALVGQLNNFAQIMMNLSNGGLIAGIAAYVKRLQPSVKVIGVEPVDADAMKRSLKAGRRVRLEQVGLFADGVAVKQVGEETFRLCRQFVDEVVLVDTAAMCAAIKDVFEDTRAVLEPAGALAIAGAKAWVVKPFKPEQMLAAVAKLCLP